MKKINLQKFGFIRDPMEDFSDDGNHFTCYKVGRVRISKLVTEGMVYIAGRIDSGDLQFKEYSELPHYKAMDRLNGTTINLMTEDDLKRFYNDCLEYEKEYTEAERNIKWPTVDEVFQKLKAKRDFYKKDVEEIKALLTVDTFLKISEYSFKSIKEYLRMSVKQANKTDQELLDWANKYYHTSYSRYTMTETYSGNKDSIVKYCLS